MTPEEAKAKIVKFYRLGIGQLAVARVENELKISVLDAMKNDDLVVIFAEQLSLNHEAGLR